MLSRIYQAIPLTLNDSVRLDERASHYVARVLRGKLGDKLILFNGEKSCEAEALITHIDKKQVTVEIIKRLSREVESPLTIYLAQGIARGEKMDFIVQKAVELGVKKIIPLITERSNVRLDSDRKDSRLAHWQAVSISACEQSGRNELPEVLAPMTFTEWLPNAEADQCFVLTPHVKTKLAKDEISNKKSILLLIGPEGGLSNQEIDEALGRDFKPLNLGPRILRTETATIAAITLFQAQYGDMG